MTWNSIRGTWSALLRGFFARQDHPAEGLPGPGGRGHRYLRGCCDVSSREAGRRQKDWIRDPGVLDDWNDTRSILDM